MKMGLKVNNHRFEKKTDINHYYTYFANDLLTDRALS